MTAIFAFTGLVVWCCLCIVALIVLADIVYEHLLKRRAATAAVDKIIGPGPVPHYPAAITLGHTASTSGCGFYDLFAEHLDTIDVSLGVVMQRCLDCGRIVELGHVVVHASNKRV